MKKSQTRHFGKALAALSGVCIFATSSGWTTVVARDLNPDSLVAPAGSTNRFVSAVGTPNMPLDFYSGNQGFARTGLGVVGPADPKLQSLNPIPGKSALFPVIGLIAAISLTQLLRRRRMAQLRADPPTDP